MSELSRKPRSRPGEIFFDQAPRFLAVLTFLTGALALISAGIPDPEYTRSAGAWLILSEIPLIGLVVGALGLMALSVGLARRIISAWWMSLGVGMYGLLYSLLLRPRLIELCLFTGLIVLLLAARKHFYRRSGLSGIAFSRNWFLMALLSCLIAGFFSLLWVSHQSGFIEARFIDLVIDPVLGVAGRPVALALLLLGLGGFYYAVASPLRLRPKLADPGDFQQVADLLQSADQPRPENLLALVGDKSIFYGPGDCAALAYAEIKGVRIAMGPPIGPKEKWKPAVEAFREKAEAEGVRPAIYAVPPELLPDLIDLKFTIEKIGENAILDLADFTLSGRKREVIRRARRKLTERLGATFELADPPHNDRLIDSLRPVSEAWLKRNGGQEKSFSLGRFDRRFLDHCPIGLVRIDGRIVAFGSLLITPDKAWAGIDLMRYDPDSATTNTMDFLLVELILWAKEAAYRKFDLAMAPLSGLVQAEHAPLYARLGQFVFERGERFYNFRGLRRFKQKFDPVWEPRYIAAPGYWSLPVVLALVGVLSNNSKLKQPLRPISQADGTEPGSEPKI